MKRILLNLFFILALSGNATAAILVLSPNGTTTTKASLAAAATALDAVGKTVVVTSPQVVTMAIAWPSDRKLKFEKSGTVSFSGAGSLTGLKEARLDNFGAKGDGTTDDQTPVQNAANAVVGGTLIIAKGTYLVDQISVGANTRVVGEGRNSIIKRKANSTVNGALVLANGVSNVQFLDFTVDGNRAKNPDEHASASGSISNQGGVRLEGSSKSTIRGVTVYSSPNYGIIVSTSTNCIVDGNNSSDHINATHPSAPLEIGVHLSSNITMTGNVAHNGGNSGFVVSESHHVISSNNVSYNNAGQGHEVYVGTGKTAHDISITGSVFRGNKLTGISVFIGGKAAYTDINGITISGNTVTDNGTMGIFIIGCKVTVANNAIRNNGDSGIHVQAANDSIYSGNIIDGNNTSNTANYSGIYFNNLQTYRNQVFGNSISLGRGHQKYAINVTGSSVTNLEIGKNNLGSGGETGIIYDAGSKTNIH